MSHWYLLKETRARSAAANMAVDQYLLDLVESQRLNHPILRIYAWERPSLSLGYHQVWNRAVDPAALKRHGIDLVRRWTGGRAVLHDYDEITYAVIAPYGSPFTNKISHNYALIGASLERFVQIPKGLAMMAESGETASETIKKRHLPCFASISTSEIEKSGKKLIGSSQKLGTKGFLQHGSIPLIHRLEVLREVTLVQQDMSGLMTSLTDHWTSAGLALPSHSQLVDRLVDSFGQQFQVCFQPLDEAATIDSKALSELVDHRYGHTSWTLRK